jgi:predicted Zn-dependent protease with MMP-like domain
MDDELFEQYVQAAWDALPVSIRDQLRNVEVVVEDWPDSEILRLAHARHRAGLLGFYHGVPLTKRGQGYYLVAPDKISIYREPILMQCSTQADAVALVERVLRHEIAHHFGISDDRLRELGAY